VTPDVPGPSFDEPDPEPASALEGNTANAAEPEAVRRQAKSQAQRQRDTAEFWRSIFATVDGRAAMWGILADVKTFEIVAGVSANGAYDPEVTAFNKGKQSVGQSLFLAWLGYDREGVLTMLAEHQPTTKEAAKNVAPRRRTRKPLPE